MAGDFGQENRLSANDGLTIDQQLTADRGKNERRPDQMMLIWSPFVFTSIGGQLLIDGQTVIGAKPIFLAEIARHPVDALSDSARFLTYGMVKIFGRRRAPCRRCQKSSPSHR